MYNQKASKNSNAKFKNPAGKFSALCFDWLETFVHAIIVVLIVFTFLFRIVTVEMTSMTNTLFDGDRLVVVNWNYTPTDGDVIIIKRGQNFEKPIVKRVIATEGESLSIDFEEGSVAVNGKKLDEPYIKEKMWLKGDAEIPSTIPKGHTFVMGDNRNGSIDSRFNDIGLIPDENVVGKAVFIIFPFNRIGAIKSPY